MLGSEVTRRYGRRRPARRHDRRCTSTGSAGPELRRVRAARHHAAARGRRQRLLRQGAVGRHARRLRPPRDATFVAEENIIVGNVIALRRDRRRGVHPRRRRRAVLRAQQRRDRGRRGRRRPRLRVHDRRARRRSSGRPAATSPPACSGGVAYVSTRRHARSGACNHEMVDLDPLDDEDVDWLRGDRHAHTRADRLARSPSGILSSWWTQRRRSS